LLATFSALTSRLARKTSNRWSVRFLRGLAMSTDDVDLLAINRGTVTAPAGCGKTHLIAVALTRHTSRKRILVLTHTNAGCVALRGRLDRFGVIPSIPTLDHRRLGDAADRNVPDAKRA
jgi:hypothetical protein